MIEKLLKLPRKFIFILIALAVVVPLLLKLVLPVNVTPPVQNLFDAVESIPPDGNPLLLSCDYDPSIQPELYPMNVAIMKHCFATNRRVLIISLLPAGLGLAEMAIEDAKKEFPDKKEGIDYTFLGFAPGGPMVVILGIGEDIHRTFPKDYYGAYTDSLPMMQTVHNYDDIPLTVTLCGSGVYSSWIIYANTRYHENLGVGATAVMATAIYPYLSSGQLIGMLGGLKGAAEYETLLARNRYSRERKTACIGMGAQSITHLLIIALIIFGNVLYFTSRRRKNVH
jgi:hypothetical protein